MNTNVTNVIVIPSYNETLALPQLLRDLKPGLSSRDAIIIMDDSSKEISKEIKQRCLESVAESDFEFRFETSGTKSGRGAAIRKGMIIALTQFPNVQYLVECDADGSHRPFDILKIKASPSRADLLVGSRYLPSSVIQGWPISRRVFSWILNRIIPRLIRVNLQDITNGLRRYSRIAIEKIVSEPQVNAGFIYLSEQAVHIARAEMKIEEESIIFVDRTLGVSTVTWREILSSIQGVLKLFGNELKR